MSYESSHINRKIGWLKRLDTGDGRTFVATCTNRVPTGALSPLRVNDHSIFDERDTLADLIRFLASAVGDVAQDFATTNGESAVFTNKVRSALDVATVLARKVGAAI